MLLLAMAIRFVNLLLAALSVGAMFGVWLVFNPRGLDGASYIVLQQQGIRQLNVVMPIMGAATIAATLAAATMARGDGTLLALLVATAVAFLLAGLITRFLNQPINAIVIHWSPSSPPAEWMTLRDAWWRWHIARLLCGIIGLSLLILAEILRDPGV
jgi:hypothetical protein